MLKTALDKSLLTLIGKNDFYKDYLSETKSVTEAWREANVGLGKTLAML